MLRSGELLLRPVGEVVLIPDRAYARAFTLRVGGTDQSYVDLADPTRIEFDYMQRIADALHSREPTAARSRIVHVGGAALTLPRYVAAVWPGSAQIVLEPDADLTALVRRHLPLPPRSGIKVRGVDGRTGIRELRDRSADVVIVDAFQGSQVPAGLTTREFLADLARVLQPGGLVLINLTDRGPFGYGRRVLAGMAATFDQVALCAEPATLKGRRFGNVLVLGSAAPLPLNPLAEAAGRPPFPYRVVYGPRLNQLIAGAPPFTDADAKPSPLPPDSRLFT